jgi:hypothetical protein
MRSYAVLALVALAALPTGVSQRLPDDEMPAAKAAKQTGNIHVKYCMS